MEYNVNNDIIISKPEIKSLPYFGVWEIKSIYGEYDSFDTDPEIMDYPVVIDKDMASMGGMYWFDISYRMRKVSFKDYFISVYRMMPVSNTMASLSVNVITVVYEGMDVVEIIFFNSEEGIVKINNIFYRIDKTKKTITENLRNILLSEKKEDNDIIDVAPSKNYNKTSLLITVREKKVYIPSEDIDYSPFQYKTYLVCSVNGIMNDIVETNDIYLPRSSGFWKIKSETSINGQNVEDILTARKLSNIPGQTHDSKIEYNEVNSLLTRRKIIYVGRDYITYEQYGYDIYDNIKKDKVPVVYTVPIDSIENKLPLNIYDLEGSQIKEASVKTGDIDEGLKLKDMVDRGYKGYEFFPFRKLGHWYLAGRFKNRDNSYFDFDIDWVISKKFVTDGEQPFDWNHIKSVVPEAKDIFVAPNEDFVAIITNEKITVHYIKNHEINKEEDLTILLNQDSEVIMAIFSQKSMAQMWYNSLSELKKIY